MNKTSLPSAQELALAPEAQLLELVQRQTFKFFWEEAHPSSGLAADRRPRSAVPLDDLITTGGSGFGVMAIIVAVSRGWITRAAAVQRINAMLDLLSRATCYHGAFPHFLNGSTGATVPFMRKDDGADLVETSFLMMGLLCARQYFDGAEPTEAKLRGLVNYIFNDVEWDWFTRGGRPALTWHWSPNNGWATDLEIRGWNECLVTYVLALGAPRYGIEPSAYHQGFASGRSFLNGKSYYGTPLPLGLPYGGPLFFAHYSFCGIDPRGLSDRYADYQAQCSAHVRINHAHCAANPHQHPGYAADCWGLTSSDGRDGYEGHAPDNDNGTLSPTAALSSLPFLPAESLAAMRHFLRVYGDRVWGRFGFVDAFNPGQNWFADTFLAIDQGPIVVMIENYRSQLLWNLFMGAAEVQRGLRSLEFKSPHLLIGE